MDSDNLTLVVGTYADAGAAADDFATLKSGQDAGEYQVVGAVVMNRDASGKVEVNEHDDKNVSGGATVGGVHIGCGRRRVNGKPKSSRPRPTESCDTATNASWTGPLKKRHEEKQLGVDVDEYLPPGSSAVVAVVDDRWADKVENALVKSDKRISKAIDSGDYDELQKAISKSSDEVSGAISS